MAMTACCIGSEMRASGTSMRFSGPCSVVIRVPSAAKIFDDWALAGIRGTTAVGVYEHPVDSAAAATAHAIATANLRMISILAFLVPLTAGTPHYRPLSEWTFSPISTLGD